MAKSKKSKRTKKAKGPYSELSAKVGKSATPSTAHLVGHEVELVLRNGSLIGDRMSVMLEHADEQGLRYSRDYRGRTENGCLPMSAVHHIERKIGKGKGENLDQVPWNTDNTPTWAEEHVGEWVTITHVADVVGAGQHGLLGTVDSSGIGYCYSSYGTERVAFRPLAGILDMSYRVAMDDEDDE